MAPQAENIWRIKAVATKRTIRAPAARPPTEIAAATGYLRQQPFIRGDGTVIAGHSAGAWGALALAGAQLQDVAAVIAFAPGRGGRANDFPNQVCAPHTLMAAAAEFGKTVRAPVTGWYRPMTAIFRPRSRGDWPKRFAAPAAKVDFQVLAAYGSEGHWLPETDGGREARGAPA